MGRKRKTDKVAIFPPFLQDDLQFGVEASRGPNKEEEKKKATSTSQEARLIQRATTIVKQLFFFFSPGFRGKASWLCV